MDYEPVQGAADVQASLRYQEPEVLLASLKRFFVPVLLDLDDEDVDDEVSYPKGRADDEQELVGQNERTRRNQPIKVHSLHVGSYASEGEAERPSEHNTVARPEQSEDPSLHGQRELNSQGCGDRCVGGQIDCQKNAAVTLSFRPDLVRLEADCQRGKKRDSQIH